MLYPPAPLDLSESKRSATSKKTLCALCNKLSGNAIFRKPASTNQASQKNPKLNNPQHSFCRLKVIFSLPTPAVFKSASSATSKQKPFQISRQSWCCHFIHAGFVLSLGVSIPDLISQYIVICKYHLLGKTASKKQIIANLSVV